MIDAVLILAVGGLVIRGWRRGFFREAVGLAALVVGTILAFRASTPVGHVVGAVAGTSPEVSRLVGGAAVFLGVSVAATLLAGLVRHGMHLMPGLPTVDRAAGAVLAGGAGVVAATLVLSVLTVLPLPAAVADPIDDSAVASRLTDPDGAAQVLLGAASGDGVMGVVLRLDDLVGAPHVGDPGDEVIVLPVSGKAPVTSRPGHADGLASLVNRSRVSADVAPLARGEALDRVAAAHAEGMYRNGRMAHVTRAGLTPGDRLDASGIPHTAVVELIGLGASPDAVVAAWLADPPARERLLASDVRRMGVGAFSGPHGLMLVMVAAG